MPPVVVSGLLLPKPSAVKVAGLELVIDRPPVWSSFSVTTPLLMVEGAATEVPEIASIAARTSLTVPVPTSIDSVPSVAEPVVAVLLNEIVVPLTVMVLPGAKPDASELVPAAPDNSVAPVIGTGAVAWLVFAVPIAALAEPKKSLPASTAEAATSDVLAMVPIAVFSAAFKLALVRAGVVPMVKPPTGGGLELDAVS